MKDDLSHKNARQYDIFIKCSEKMIFPKTIALEYDFSCCIIKKDDISFSRKYYLIFLKENERLSFSKNTWNYDIFFKCPENMVYTWSSPEKIHLKLTDILDHILEKVPTILCTFMET